jgi:hypothetical protein
MSRFSLGFLGKNTAHVAFGDTHLTGDGASGFLGSCGPSRDDLVAQRAACEALALVRPVASQSSDRTPSKSQSLRSGRAMPRGRGPEKSQSQATPPEGWPQCLT